jgi:hypothetical protein
LTSATPATTSAIAAAKAGVTGSANVIHPAKTPTRGVTKVKAESCGAG